MKTLTIVSLLAALTFAGQGRADEMPAAQLNDSQIAEIMKKANDAEIDAAKMARSQTHNAEVKNFAQHMIDEHTKNNKMAAKVEGEKHIAMADSPNSKALDQDAEAKTKDLRASSKGAFDRTYIDQQVAMHSQLLKDLDATYIPQAQNVEMKTFLEQTRMHVAKHLQTAQQIQSKLESKSATSQQ